MSVTSSRSWTARLGGHDFVRLWTASTVSWAGTAVTSMALPIIALVTLQASTFEYGLISAAGLICWLVFGLAAGVWVDRVLRRPLLITCDIVRGVALLTVPVAAMLDVLTIAHLVVVALIIGFCSVLFDIGNQAYLPSVVERSELLAGNSKMQASDAAARTGGPALGGGLVQLLGAPLTLVVDVISYFVSVFLLLSVRKQEEPLARQEKPRMLPQIREGLAYVLTDPLLRPLAFLAAAINFLTAAFDVVLVPFLLRSAGFAPGVIGLLIGIGGIGGVAGAVVGAAVSRKIGSGRTLMIAAVAGALFSLLVPVAAPGVIGVVAFCVGLIGRNASDATISVLARTLRQATAPRELLARVTASIKFLSWGVLPIGALAGGALGEWLGDSTAMWVVCGLFMLTCLPLVLSPIRGMRDLV